MSDHHTIRIPVFVTSLAMALVWAITSAIAVVASVDAWGPWAFTTAIPLALGTVLLPIKLADADRHRGADYRGEVAA